MGYKSTREDIVRAYTIGIVYVVMSILLGFMLIKIWPPIPWPTPEHKRKGVLAALVAETGCTPTPTPTPAPTATPAATPTATPAQTATPTPTPTAAAGTPRPAGAQTGTQPTAQPGTTGGAQTPGPAATNTPTTQPATGGAATPQTTPQTGVTTDSTGEIITIPISVLGRCVQTTFDERLLLLVIVVGVLGAFVHGATSLADYIGNNSFNRSWTWFYLLRPAIGMSLALVFYFVIRGGFLSTTGGAQDINPYGIAALAGLVGMFSKQATDKLSEVFGTLFRSAPGEGDAKRQHKLEAPIAATTIQLEPAAAVAAGEAFKLTVSGTGFVDGAVVQVNDVAQPTTFESANKVSAQISKETIANPSTLKVTVINPDQTKFGPVDLVVSASDAGS